MILQIFKYPHFTYKTLTADKHQAEIQAIVMHHRKDAFTEGNHVDPLIDCFFGAKREDN